MLFGSAYGNSPSRNNLIDLRLRLYAYLGAEFQETLRARTIHGSTVDRIPLIDMPDFPIRDRFPPWMFRSPLPRFWRAGTQQALNFTHQMNETLEGMASGFVQVVVHKRDSILSMQKPKDDRVNCLNPYRLCFRVDLRIQRSAT